MFAIQSGSQRFSSKHKLPRRTQLLLVCADVYAFGLLLYLMARFLTGFRLWPVALFSNFLHLALLPTLVLLPVMLLMRHWPGAAMTGACVLAFAWLFGQLFLPPWHAEPGRMSDDFSVKVMTFNLGSDLAETAPERLTQIVLDSDADVIAFQEVNLAHADALQHELREMYPYQAVYAAGESTLGIALISRYPIVEARQFSGSIPWLPYQEAKIDVDGRLLHMLNAHPAPPGWSLSLRNFYFSRSRDDMHQFVTMVGDDPGLLVGDFNVADQSEDYAILSRAGLVDSYRVAGYGFGLTYPANRWYGYTNTPTIPLVRIDYIWHTPHFRTIRAWVGGDAGSDHLPVLAELAWADR